MKKKIIIAVGLNGEIAVLDHPEPDSSEALTIPNDCSLGWKPGVWHCEYDSDKLYRFYKPLDRKRLWKPK